jgi:hypothetical protein
MHFYHKLSTLDFIFPTLSSPCSLSSVLTHLPPPATSTLSIYPIRFFQKVKPQLEEQFVISIWIQRVINPINPTTSGPVKTW